MKHIFQFFALTLLIISGVLSCKKSEFNINNNPNQATDSTIVYNVILPSAENNTGYIVAQNWGWLQNYLGYWARSGTYAPNTQEETYELTTGFQSQIWTNIYDNLYDYQSMLLSSRKNGADFYEGIARIMKAHNFALLVDIYNNIPYSQSLKGGSNNTPGYDNGIDIYKDLLRQIDTGIALIKGSSADATSNKSLTTDDIMFGTTNYPGTGVDEMKVRWAQFGNTMKLRLLTHCMNGGLPANSDGSVGSPASTVTGIDMASEFGILTAEGSGYLSSDASVQPGYATDKSNPFYGSYVKDAAGTPTQNAVYYDANEYAIAYYGGNADPRRAYFYTPVGSSFVGVAYGLPSMTENADANLSGIGPGLTGTDATAAQRILTAAESYFLQAECMNRGFLAGPADSTMNMGIRASFESLYTTAGDAIADADVDAQDYIDGNAGFADVDYNAVEDANNIANGGLYTIISQKWFALNGIAPYEVWSDYRRVDYSSAINHFVYGAVVGFDPGPPISVSPANAKTEIPVRLLYPQNEYLYNAINVGAQPSVGTYPYSHIFWDLK